MLINGQKYACDSCVRGHRTKSCQHSDRPLIHISEKGRPPSQCFHCRTLRKSRSVHVRCDCGEKIRGTKPCTHGENSKFTPDACCCSHGARCTCALKKETLDPILERGVDEASMSTASVDKGRPPSDLPPKVRVDNGTGMALTCELPYVVSETFLNDAARLNTMTPSTDDPTLGNNGTRPAFPYLQGRHASSQQDQNIVDSSCLPLHLASLTDMDYPRHQSESLNMFRPDLGSTDEQIPPLHDWVSENPPGSFNYPTDFDNLDSLAEMDQATFSAGLYSPPFTWFHTDL